MTAAYSCAGQAQRVTAAADTFTTSLIGVTAATNVPAGGTTNHRWVRDPDGQLLGLTAWGEQVVGTEGWAQRRCRRSDRRTPSCAAEE